MIGGRRVRAIDRDDVHAGQHLVEAFPIGCLQLAFNLRHDTTAVMVVNLQAERTGPAGHRLADPPHAYDAEALSTDADRASRLAPSQATPFPPSSRRRLPPDGAAPPE